MGDIAISKVSIDCIRKELPMKTDAQIQKDVLEELKWDTRVKETDVGVQVNEGIVTLTGTLESWTARMAAQEAAHRVAGVLDVANEIKVLPWTSCKRTDSEIAKAVRQALEWDVCVPDEKIRSTVSDGVVTLEGSVELWTQHDDAGRAVRNLAGVREVRNMIAVVPPQVEEHRIRAEIDGALIRHVEHASKRVKIAVQGDTVILRGEVPSWSERNAIVGAVKGTPGVRKIENELRIRA
jgi:osmotically-inducible protein OsmY